ncbi:hypothetical protein ACGFYU_06680 [Streptomyces sp. NPDC048337]|uniref:hypothetical protein n=1 Tax=Streptomyces sp. NPDC048337 TaxID=3365535 RepID=UPI00371F39C9
MASGDYGKTARKVVALLAEDPDAPSPVARRLRELLLERLPTERREDLLAFEREPFAPDRADALAAALMELPEADPETAAGVAALARGYLGGSAEDTEWAERFGGRPIPAGVFLLLPALAFFILTVIAAFSGPPPDMP